MLLLGLDLETTGLNPNSDQIIEVGAVVWDTDRNAPVDILNDLIDIGELQVPVEITQITGIATQDLLNFGKEEEEVLGKLLELMDKCDYVVAHNGNNFDKKFLEEAFAKYGMNNDKEWIDTLYDVPYSDDIKTRKLTYLAAEHRFLNPYAHRAIFDVMAMFKVLENYNIDEVIQLSKSPTIKVQAKVSYDDREKAKQAGFRWDAPNRAWVKEMKEVHLQQSSFPFECVTL